MGTITLDMQRPGYAVIYAVQFDKLTRQITAQLTDKGLPWTVPMGALMTIRYSKPDGTQGFYDTLEDGTTAYTISGSAVTFTLAQQALAAAGNVLMQLNFYTAGGEALSSFSFIVTVQPSVLNDAEVISSDYYNIMTGMLTQFAEQIEDLDNALRAGYGAPLKAATVSAMTDHAKIYVYTGSETGYTAGHWYYYNGTAWTDGGVYNAVAVNTDTTLTLAGVPADAKATGDAVGELKSDLHNISGIDFYSIPAGYTSKYFLEKIDGTPLIDTGIGWSAYHPRIVIDVESTGGPLFGNYHATTRRLYGGVGSTWAYGPTRVTASETEQYIGKRIVADYSDTYLKINDVTIATFDSSGASGSANALQVFGYKFTGSGTTANGYANAGTKIYGIKLYKPINDGWELAFNGVPCKRDSDGQAGLYDTVTNTFHTYTEGNVIARDYPNISTIDGEIKSIESGLSLGRIDYDTIAGYGNDGVFTDSFTFNIPFNGLYDNQIFSCYAKYERNNSNEYPTIRFVTGSGLSRTSDYVIGGENVFEKKEWRIVRYPGYTTAYTAIVTIPDGITVTIRDFANRYDNSISRLNNGIVINGHRKLPMTPSDTMPGVIMAAQAGLSNMIEIPKRLSDGKWIFYHDDSLTYNDTYIRQSDGSTLPSTYVNTPWSQIDYDTANSWDWGISTSNVYAGTKPMTMESFFEYCAKTGIKPSLSLHNADNLITAESLGEIKALARKYGVLSALTLKTGASSMSTVYNVFGNDVYMYVLDVSSGSQTVSVINSAIDKMDSLTGCTAKRAIELFASTAFNAYFGENPYQPFELISAAGYICSLCQQTGNYNPTNPGSSTVVINGADYEWWINKGVTEFTAEYNYSMGLNW